MDFKQFNDQIQKQFDKMCETGKLFRANITGSKVWDTYLSSFEDEKIFRDPESSEHNCNNCNNFIRRYGNIVAIIDGKLESIFTNLVDIPTQYVKPSQAMNELLVNSIIENVFFETFSELNSLPYESCNRTQPVYQLGKAKDLKRYTEAEAKTFGVVNSTDVYEFNHFNLKVPRAFVSDDPHKSVEAIMATYRDKHAVFARAMQEIPLDTLELVKDLINQGSLLDGDAHLHAVEAMIPYKKKFNSLFADSGYLADNWCWETTYYINEATAKFKNHLIGVLCTELAEGKELNEACKAWNIRVDPINYNKATAPITQKQIKSAQQFVEENDYVESFNRRLATIDDIKASEILHVNSGDGKIKEVSIFDNVKSTSTQHKRAKYNDVEEISIEKFMSDILPGCTSVEALLTNKMESNLVTLTTANDKDSKPIFKWSNNYSWTFNGNLAGKSYIKDAVKAHGGGVDGALRFSLMWAEGDPTDNSDLDAHCKEPNGHICFSNMRVRGGGNLDIDITHPVEQRNNKNVAENITWPDLSTMTNGRYEMIAHNYADRGNKYFEAEIEFGSEIYNYRYNKPLPNKKAIVVAIVTLKDGEFTIEHKLPETSQSKEIWGLETNTFHKVNLVCLSPNHWGDNTVGNKHYIFMLDKCKTVTSTRGFHNENLNADLLKHKKVMEVLGATNMIEPTDKQLSGIGFNSTVKDELIVKCSGSFKRMLKIKF